MDTFLPIPISSPSVPAAPEVDAALIQKYGGAGPRYTSYPTADRFHASHGVDAHRQALILAAGTADHPLSVYIHVPFCNTICYYCGCNKVVTKDHGRSAEYLRYLEREFALVAALLPGRRRVAQVHLGGGTPTFLTSDELESLMASLGRHFEMTHGEYAIEIDPRTVDDDKIATLARLGFGRMSLGVQDFDADVQRAVNRVQSMEQTARVMATARAHGVASINVDLIYGLPRQTYARFARTLDTVISLRPERVALYGYAHLPTLFKPQRRIVSAELPDAAEKLAIMVLAIERLTQAGYEYLGMDHFALPEDELAVAAREGRMHRNFQGYSASPGGDLVAFGVSAISSVGDTHSQNAKTLDEYYARLDAGELPVLRGIALSADDVLRRGVIQALMCNFHLPIATFESTHRIDFRQYFAPELARLAALAEDGLVSLTDDAIAVTPRGRLLVRNIAMAFDAYLPRAAERQGFSRVI